jgi:hypothetical protein
VIETIPASRCPRCDALVAPPAAFCPRHPIAMEPAALPGTGEVVTFTTLFSPPEGFRSPLHLAIIRLEGGAQLVCHGTETRGLKIGSRVAVESVDDIYYFSNLGVLDRARLFWRRAGDAGERVNAIARSLAKRAWRRAR